MGQQQLLLLVLGIVIVGLAVVVGIQAFSENQKKANADSLVNDGIRIASDAQAWSLKPQAFGGPAAGEALGDVTFADIGLTTATVTTYSNTNGEFTIEDNTAAGACVIFKGSNGLTGDKLNEIYIEVTGTAQDEISTSINPATAPTC